MVKQVKEFYQVPFINAAAWLLPKDTIKKVGFFDKLFYHYGEDVNYCQRLTYHDLKIIFVPDAKIFHDREDRDIKIKNGDKDKKRKLKIELANVNNSKNYIHKRFRYLKKHYLIKLIKNLIMIKSFNDNLELFKFINKSKKEILESWEINKK